MATQLQVTNYTGYILQEFSRYGDKLATQHQIGEKPSFDKEVKLALLSVFVDIADRYLDEWNSTTSDNLMTVAEFEEIMEHINRIANSFHWLNLE